MDVAAVCLAEDGVANDVAFKGHQFVVNDGGFAEVGQPGVVHVAFDFAGGEVNVGFDEVA